MLGGTREAVRALLADGWPKGHKATMLVSDEAGVLPGCRARDNVTHDIGVLAEDDQTLWLDDARFFTGDLRQRMAQVGLVIEIDSRDRDRDLGSLVASTQIQQWIFQ